MGKRYSYEMDTDAVELTKNFSNGESCVLSYANLSDEMNTRLWEYGARQLLSDRHSGIKELEAIISNTKETIEGLVNGTWSQPRAGAGTDVEGMAKVIAHASTMSDGPAVSVEKVMEALAKFAPEDGDDEETAEKKSKILAKMRATPEYRLAAKDLKGSKAPSLAEMLTADVPAPSAEAEAA